MGASHMIFFFSTHLDAECIKCQPCLLHTIHQNWLRCCLRFMDDSGPASVLDFVLGHGLDLGSL